MPHSCEGRNLQAQFDACQKILNAFGDEVRQKILLLMAEGGERWVRAADIAEKTSLTRSAVSHHMQILKDAGIIVSRKDGKCVYYAFNSQEQKIEALMNLFMEIQQVLRAAPAEAEGTPHD